jgi:gluconate 2-dehydrogenase gamma chain
MVQSPIDNQPGLFRNPMGEREHFLYTGLRSETLLLRRRQFLVSLLAGASAVATARTAADILPMPPGGGVTSPLARVLEEAPWPLLEGVQSHLFPSEADSPGAAQINALAYLQDALGREEGDAIEDRRFLTAGAAFLRKRIALDYGGRLFEELGEEEREAALRKMAGSTDGANWISLVMYYLLEALLADPVYGGNTDEVGWKWLGYTAGFPRPPIGKRYFEIKPA